MGHVEAIGEGRSHIKDYDQCKSVCLRCIDKKRQNAYQHRFLPKFVQRTALGGESWVELTSDYPRVENLVCEFSLHQ